MEDIAKEINKEAAEAVMPEADNVGNDSSMGGFVLCPRCNWDTRHELIPIDEEDKKEFLRCLLGGNQFKKEYSLFGDNFKITYIDLTSKESDAMVNSLSTLGEDPMFLPKAIKIKMLFGLVSFKTGEDDLVVDRDALSGLTGEEVLAKYDKILGDLSETMTGAFAKIYNDFNNLLITMTEAGFDENFWKGAGRD